MNKTKVSSKNEKQNLLKIERDAVEFAQSLLSGSTSNQKDPLSKIERDALSYAKKLLSK